MLWGRRKEQVLGRNRMSESLEVRERARGAERVRVEEGRGPAAFQDVRE
jgi:hypothetical protein